MRYLYAVTSLVVVLLQVLFLDFGPWALVSLPLIFALAVYIRRGFQWALVYGAVVMWLWDLHFFTFGLRALLLLITLAALHFLRVTLFSENSFLGIAALSLVGSLLFNGLLILSQGILLGFRYISFNWSQVWLMLVALGITVVICWLAHQLGERWHTVIKR